MLKQTEVKIAQESKTKIMTLISRKNKRSIKLINRSFTVANIIQLKKTKRVQKEYNEFFTSPKSKD